MNDTNFDKNILFVDNSRTTRAVMSKFLESKGLIVDCAKSGPEALEMLQNPENKGKYKLVIMDLYMPMMNGYEAAKLIRDFNDADTRNIPLIALSASSDQKDKTISQDAGMNEFVTKTPDHLPLIETIKKYCDIA